MIYLGTSGFSYSDWKNVFYPPDLSKAKWLEFYAAEFSAVELNFTYYRMPEAEYLRRMAAQTPETFMFAVKAHQDITHNRAEDPAPFAQFRAALLPLQREKKLGAVLLQFPYAFRNTEENVRYLEYCFTQLADLPLVVEFRQKDWLARSTVDWLRESHVAFCNVDMPQLPGLLPRTSLVTAPLAYVRFHGRNTRKWWQHEESWERYNYSYTEEELAEWVPQINKMDEQAENLYAFANNHWSGQAVSTVRQLKMLLDREVQENIGG